MSQSNRQGTRKGCPYYTTKRLGKPVYSRGGVAPALEHRPYLLKSAPKGHPLAGALAPGSSAYYLYCTSLIIT
ncbi:MAG: hypothetical protein ACJ795_12965 [Ktedonobacteraceae bacterium]